VVCTSHHCIALTKDGKCFIWDNNSNHQLGINTGEDEFISTPQELPLPNNIPFIDVSAGYNYSMATNLNNEIFVWGSNEFGQLGQGIELRYYEEPTMLYLVEEFDENVNQTPSESSKKEIDENERIKKKKN